MNRIQLNDAAFDVPASWTQVPPAQLPPLAVATLSKPDARLRLQVLQLLCPALPMRLVRKLSAEDRHRIVFGLTAWVWEEKLPAGLLTRFEHAGQAWLLPAASFADVSLAEYIMLHHQLRIYCLTGEAEHLAQLLATACRPARPEAETRDGLGPREKYNGHVCAGRAAIMATVPLGYALLVVPHLTAGLQRVYEQHKELYTAAGSASDEPADTGTDSAVRGLIDMAYGLAEQSLFGDFDATCGTSVHTVLDYLDYRRRNAPKAQE